MSTLEVTLSRSLRTAIAALPNGGHVVISDEFRQDVLTDLEYFLPSVLAELYKEWMGESFDGIYPALARKIADNAIEVFGVGILLSDQALVPIYCSLQIAAIQDEVSWLLLKVGEKLSGDRGETGKRGMKRLPYSKLDSALARIRRLNGDADRIDWVYKVTFGERHSDFDSGTCN